MGTRARLTALVLVTSLPILLAPAALGTPPDPAPVGTPVQFIVTWASDAPQDVRDATLKGVSPTRRARLSASPAGADLELVDLPAGDAASSALTALRGSPGVASVEPNRVLRAAGKPRLSNLFNDPLLADGTFWHLLGDDTNPGNEFGINAVRAFTAGTLGDPNVYVGVVDEGVDVAHPDLAKNVFTNRWDPPNGRDDDHNGYVDDVHGWDFYNNDASLYDGLEHFDFIDAHGTIVAGEIAGIQGNRLGGSGAAPRVKVIPAKFLGPLEGTIAGAIAALDYLTDLKVRHGLNIVATNNSWGGDDADSQALEAAIQRGADAGILFVASAGNGDGNGLGFDLEVTPGYPAALHCTLRSGEDCMIVTTAIDRKGRKAPWANFGKATVDLGAPGVDVYSTFPFADYVAYEGTSQSAPLVAATVALYRSKYPRSTPTAARRAILRTAAPTKSLAGKTVTGGRLDVAAALAYNR